MHPRQRSRILVALALSALTATPALAGTLAGVTMPDRVPLGQSQLVLNGMGLRQATMFKVDVYVAGLYLEHRSSDPRAILESDRPKLIHLRFVHNVGSADISRAFREGFEKNSPAAIPALGPRIQEMLAWMPKFKSGDTLTFIYRPGGGTEVLINGHRRGVIAGRDFGRAVFALWLGPTPPSKDMQRGLLGTR